jgi:Predicted Rossmann fold nucleotide-binding protein
MEAAARSAKAEGGLTVGILPGSSKEEANLYIDIKIPTDMGHARNAIIEQPIVSSQLLADTARFLKLPLHSRWKSR